MCQECEQKAEAARPVVDAIVHGEKHIRVLYPRDNNAQHCVRLAQTILHSRTDDGGTLTPDDIQCLALQYATVVQRLLALHEISGIPL